MSAVGASLMSEHCIELTNLKSGPYHLTSGGSK